MSEVTAIVTKMFAVCPHCGHDNMHFHDSPQDIDDIENPPNFSCKSGGYVIRLSCEGCPKFSFLCIGDHKGSVFIEVLPINSEEW